MYTQAGVIIALIADFHEPKRARAGDTTCTHHQFHRIGTHNIRDETGAGGGRILQYCAAARRFGGKRPGVGQRLARCRARAAAVQGGQFAHTNGNDQSGIGIHV